MQSLTTYIQHPELLNAEVVLNLEQLVERHPSFQTARLLYLLGLFHLQDDRFGAELRKAAICLPDRRQLFYLFDSDHYHWSEAKQAAPKDTVTNTPTPAPPSAASSQTDLSQAVSVHMTVPSSENQSAAPADDADTDRTQTLIDSFLSQLPEQPKPKSRGADATVDYMSYLMQLEDVPAIQNPDKEEDTDSLVSDLEEEIGKEAHIVHKNDPSDTYFTETLARIYIKQGKYTKAIEIIRRISLIYPKKNRYFADQIRFLEKLIINERASNEEIINKNI